MTKPRKVKSWKSDTIPANQMILRMVEVRRELANSESKSVPVVIASEHPVERYNADSDEIYHEILSMSGVRFRANRDQLPIVDSHDRSTVRNVLGSVRNIRVEGTQLVGDATFARDQDSQIAFEKLLDGHLTDFSITATPNNAQRIRRGESFVLGDRSIDGPAVLVTDWTPTDASLVAAGADETSTVRELLRSYQVPKKGISRMLSEQVKAALVAKGMPEQIDDTEQALMWMLGLLTDPNAQAEPVIEVEPIESMDHEDDKEEIESAKRGKREDEDVEEVVDRALKQDRRRRKEIVALCERAGIERATADSYCDSGLSLETAREKILERMMAKNGPVGSSVQVVSEGRDRFQAALRDGLISRSLQACSSRTRLENPAEGYKDFSRMSLLRMAEECLRQDGIQTYQLAPRDMALAAMGHRGTIERLRGQGIIRDAFHTTGSFPNLMLDAANKTLLAGYEEAPYTWSIWARQAPSVADFKNINRIRFSEAPNLLMVPENDLYPEGQMSDSRESYKVEKFGRLFTVTWETVVNDDLDAISRIPQMHGNAARRTQNIKVYEVLTSNPLMGDGFNLFSASHPSGDNTSGSAGAPSVGTLNSAFVKMMLQKGLNSSAVLNIQPRYLIVPAAYAATAMQVVGSIADPSAGGSAVGNSNTLNIYGPNGSRPLQVVAEPQLDGNSATIWYLAADTAQIDTVELSFLQGEESPVLEQEWDFDKDCYKYKIRQTFGVKAIDWRGLFRNSA